ncbi:MAG: hypothetical protein RL695_1317 [Pseudomonadota bacterium]|jgi:hypothetical protein
MDTENLAAGNVTPESAPPESWQTLLEAACARHPRGRAGVADRLGVSRAYVSRALATAAGGKSGIGSGVGEKFQRRVIDRLCEVRECPATLQAQPVSECRRIAKPAAPTHNPLLMRIWGVCQTCIYRPLSPTPKEPS